MNRNIQMISQPTKSISDSTRRLASVQSQSQNFKINQIYEPQSSEQLTVRKNGQGVQNILKFLENRENKENREFLNTKNESLRQKNIQKFNSDKENSLKSSGMMERVLQQRKIQDLKNRFKKIKCNYDENHKRINVNASMQDRVSNQLQQCGEVNSLLEVNQFSISFEELNSSQKKQLKNGSEYSFFENGQERSLQQGRSLQSGKDSMRQNSTRSANQSLNSLQVAQKYRSLSRQLQSFRQVELIELLIEEIEDNEKNKHCIGVQQSDNELLKKQLQLKEDLVSKLKRDMDSKREQVQILLATEKKNLQIIEKLKKNTLNTSQKDTQSLLLNDKLNSFNPVEKQSVKMLLRQVDNKQENEFKIKHDQMEKYMNEYINNVNEAYEEYKRNLAELKQQNSKLKQKINKISAQLEDSLETNRQLENQLNLVSGQLNLLTVEAEKLSHALSNSKKVIKELEEEFILLKDENQQLKSYSYSQQSTIQNHSEQLQSLKRNLQQQIHYFDQQNKHLTNQNRILNKELKEIQTKILSNTQIQAEIRDIISILTEDKTRIQQQLQNSRETIQTLNLNSFTQQQKINQLVQEKEKERQAKTILQGQIKQLQKTQTQLRNKLDLFHEQNSLLSQQNCILKQTNSQMQKLQQQLLQEYQTEKQQKSKLEKQLLSIMTQVKQMQTIYVSELSSNEQIKKQLLSFWQQNQLNLQSHTKSLSHQSKSNPGSRNSSTPKINCCESHDQELESGQISFKKNSKMTKEGSSSIFKQNSHQQISTYSKASEHRSPSVQQSMISERYFSETDSEHNNQLRILQTSKKVNVNLMSQNHSKPNSCKKTLQFNH